VYFELRNAVSIRTELQLFGRSSTWWSSEELQQVTFLTSCSSLLSLSLQLSDALGDWPSGGSNQQPQPGGAWPGQPANSTWPGTVIIITLSSFIVDRFKKKKEIFNSAGFKIRV